MSAAKVLIVGAGIGGLTAAIALGRRGVAVTVVERAGAIAPAGAGIGLQPNATAVLAALGVTFDPDDVSPIGEFWMVDARGRRIFGGTPIAVDAPHPGINIRRTDLHHTLLAACGRDRVRLGVEVVDLADAGDDGVRVDLSDGSRERWDLVVGADGLHSTVRRAILPAAACEPRYTGQTCWRLCLEAPDLASTSSLEHWIPGRRCGVIPLARGGIYVYLVESAPAGSAGPGSAAIGPLQRRFAGVDRDLDAILARAAADPTVLVHHGDLVDLPVYSSGRGRVILIGDAGHAMTPNLGQGAATAIEDAAALALLWPESGPPIDLPARLAAERRSRVLALHRNAWRLGQLAHWRAPIARWLRDGLLRALPERLLRRGVEESWAPGIALAERFRALAGSAASDAAVVETTCP